MENITSEAPDSMINNLNFSLPETAQYVVSRRFINYFPSGSNIYATNAGNRSIRFYISGDSNQYLDLSSIRMFANLQNNDPTRAKFLRPLGDLSTFFSRLRITVGGVLVEDIIEYNRHCQLYNSFKAKYVRDMDDIESGANPRWDADYHNYANGLDNFLKPNNAGDAVDITADGDHNEWGRIDKRYTRHSICGISGANGRMKLGHKFCSGLLQSSYFLPLRIAPVEIELTLVSDPNDPVVVPFGTAPAQTDDNGYYFQEGNTSTSWELNNVILRGAVVSLDNTVDNSITSHLLSGSSLKLVLPQYHTITQTFNSGAGDINMNIVKSASKLSHAFITLYREPRSGELFNNYMVDNYVYKRWNCFYNPMINGLINDGPDPDGANREAFQGKGFQDSSRNISWQLQIGNRKFPEFEAQSLSETFYYLRQTLNLLYPDQQSVSFSFRQFRENKYVIACSFSKVPDMAFTSENTKMGSLITMKLKATEGQFFTAEPRELFVHLISETILELTESGPILHD